eukprot:scaffold1056_cov564-Prasinococcus_capsulatus_cf.AAC.22
MDSHDSAMFVHGLHSAQQSEFLHPGQVERQRRAQQVPGVLPGPAVLVRVYRLFLTAKRHAIGLRQCSTTFLWGSTHAAGKASRKLRLQRPLPMSTSHRPPTWFMSRTFPQLHRQQAVAKAESLVYCRRWQNEA